MRSTSKSAAARLLIVIGRGLAAGFAPDLVWQLQQGGFETRIAFASEAEGWAAPETLRALSGAAVLFREPHPAWADRAEPFAATVAIGLSSATLSDITKGAARGPAVELFLRRGGPLFALHEAFAEDCAPIIRECASRGHTLFELPRLPGTWRSAFERFFADLVLFLSRRGPLESFPVVVSRIIPEQLSALAGDPPAWKAELERHLRRLGFPRPTTAPDATTRLLIETYEGPFPVRSKKSRGTALSVTLDPTEAEMASNLSSDALCVRFVHPDAPQSGIDTLTESGVLVIRRQPQGHLIVTDTGGDRLLPAVSAQPAFQRLAELLADRLAQSAG